MEIVKLTLKFIWKYQGWRIARSFQIRTKWQSNEYNNSDKATIIKIMWHWHDVRHIIEWSEMILVCEGDIVEQWKNDGLFNECC